MNRYPSLLLLCLAPALLTGCSQQVEPLSAAQLNGRWHCTTPHSQLTDEDSRVMSSRAEITVSHQAMVHVKQLERHILYQAANMQRRSEFEVLSRGDYHFDGYTLRLQRASQEALGVVRDDLGRLSHDLQSVTGLAWSHQPEQLRVVPHNQKRIDFVDTASDWWLRCSRPVS